jgi:hypothetical protein
MMRPVPERTTLHWKYEDGPPDAEGEDPNDVGPAWIIEPDGSERDVRGGQWVTRAEAIRLAAEQGIDLDLDDGAPDPGEIAAVAIDVAALNERVRAIGVSENELLVARRHNRFDLTGTIPDMHARHDRPDDEPADHLISYTVFSVEGLYELLDKFAPGWR